MIDADRGLAILRASFVARFEYLRAASATSSESRRPVELDQTSAGRVSRMDAMQVQAMGPGMALAMERRRHDVARRIEAAIGRIDDGEYGYCIACGEEISPKRLAAGPTIPTCISCAA